MKRSLRNLIEYNTLTIDGHEGKVLDFLFDEESWIIRYLDSDYRELVQKNRVLIPRIFLKEPDWERKRFPVDLYGENITSCPDLNDHVPVSREYEEKLNRHYRIDPYWPYIYPWASATGIFFPPRPLSIPSKALDEDELSTNLRSYREVSRYHVRATNGRLGHIHDIIVDDGDWQIVYIVVDTSDWLPWSRKVLLAIDWLEKISYTGKEVGIDLTTETIKKAPEFDERHPLELDFEKATYDFYERAFVHR
jgi:hypothetical protein